VRAGVIYKDANVTVTAFPTKHGEWPETFGYRFDTADRSVVIAGDTTAVQATIDACHGCDVLIHEATPLAARTKMSPERLEYSKKYHTSSVELAELAAKAKPGLLIVSHTTVGARPGVIPGTITIAQFLNEMKPYYNGQIVVARDLDVF
jgi:ribonuclease BN (tRNA processing enzyme)